jgi:hypothetical protein
LLTIANLRGVKESGRAFARPDIRLRSGDLRAAAGGLCEGRVRERASRRPARTTSFAPWPTLAGCLRCLWFYARSHRAGRR